MIYIGIDPGITGAVAILHDNQLKELIDIPSILKGISSSVKYEIDAHGLSRIIAGAIYHIGSNKEQILGAVERVNSRPGQSAPSTFSMGDSFGVCRAVLAGLGVSSNYVTPATWKKHYRLTSDKEESRALASRRFPTAELHLKKHADRAEAILIALYLKEVINKSNGVIKNF